MTLLVVLIMPPSYVHICCYIPFMDHFFFFFFSPAICNYVYRVIVQPPQSIATELSRYMPVHRHKFSLLSGKGSLHSRWHWCV